MTSRRPETASDRLERTSSLALTHPAARSRALLAETAIGTLLEHIVGIYMESSRRICDAAAAVIDIFFIGNDFGSQTGPLLGPEQFERFTLPRLQRLINQGSRLRLGGRYHEQTSQKHYSSSFVPARGRVVAC